MAPATHILQQLQQIVEGGASPAPKPVGLLTTQHRETWAEARERLMAGEGGREGGKGGRKGGRERGSEGARERGREGGREGGKGREGKGREGKGREGGREGVSE